MSAKFIDFHIIVMEDSNDGEVVGQLYRYFELLNAKGFLID